MSTNLSILSAVSGNNTKTMSSREIAQLTGKRHDNVKVDIEKMVVELELDLLTFQEVLKNDQNQSVTIYNLPKRECLILVSGYNIKMRAAIIDRWQELEGQQKQLSPMEMVIASAQAIIALEQKQAEQAKMLNSQQAELAEIKERQDRMDRDTKYMTALAYCREKGIPAPLKVANKLGKDAAKYCKDNGIAIGKVPDERWGSVNSYPRIVLDGLM